MPKPATLNATVALVRQSGLVSEERLKSFLAGMKSDRLSEITPETLLQQMCEAGLLTPFQARQLQLGRHQGFRLGTYRILDRIGAGGMGQVYLAEHVTLGRRVAIKVLVSNNKTAPMAKERFIREALAAAKLSHPNIVQIQDLNTDVEPAYMVMEYLDGVSLQAAVADSGTFLPAEAAICAQQVALGLQHAHEHGLVHRDIKPANIMMDRHGVAKILDLGIVRVEGESLTQVASEQLILGTIEYFAPEQAMDSSNVDIRADIYSLGATLYFLLTGRPPFGDGPARIKMMRLISSEPTPISTFRPDFQADFASLIHRMLAKKPEDRPQSPVELAATLATWTTNWPSDFPARLFAHSRQTRHDHADTPTRFPVRTPAPSTVCRNPSVRERLGPNTDGFISDPTDVNIAPIEATIPTPISPATVEVGAVSAKQQPHAISGRLKLALVLGGLIIGLGLVMLVWLLQAPKPAARTPAVVPVVDDKARLSQNTLWVTRTAGPGRYTTVAEAVRAAKPGDRIEIRDDTWRENLVLHDSSVKIPGELTITGGDKLVRWLPPPAADGLPLMSIQSRYRIRLENLLLDGEGRCGTAVVRVASSAGPHLDRVTLQNFPQYGIHAVDCSPFVKPFTIENCRFVGNINGANSTALYLGTTNPTVTLNKPVVTQCRFEGPLGHAITIQGETQEMLVQQSRFLDCTNAITMHGSLLPGLTPRHPIGLRLERNVFVNGQTVCNIPSLPEIQPGQLRWAGNLFDGVDSLGVLPVEATRTGEACPPAIWTTAYPEGEGIPPINARFLTEFTLPENSLASEVTVHLHAANEVQAWVNGVEVLPRSACDGLVLQARIQEAARPGRNLLAVKCWHTAGHLVGGPALGRPCLVAAVNVAGKNVLSASQPWRCQTLEDKEPNWLQPEFDPQVWPLAVPLRNDAGTPLQPRLVWNPVLDSRKVEDGWVVDEGWNVALSQPPLAALPVAVRMLNGLPTVAVPSRDPNKEKRFLRLDYQVLPDSLRDRFGLPRE